MIPSPLPSVEALRQQALLAAIRAPDPTAALPSLAADCRVAGPPARIASGLAAYRGNVEAAAERALSTAFPTVVAMVGAGDFGRLAHEYLHDDPPQSGDLGEWGATFASWLGRHALLVEWPYLGNCAALDHAVHRCERAADAVFDAESLKLLESTDPASLHLRLRPGTSVLLSAWPIATIHAAHRDPSPDLGTARVALAERRAEQALVVRSGWRGAVIPIDLPTADWTRCLLDGIDLAAALDRAGDSFDFAEWLATALRGGWLQGVVRSPD